MIAVIIIGILAVFFAHSARYQFGRYGSEIAFLIITIFLAIRYDYGNDYMTHAGGTSSLLTSKIEGELIQDGDPWNMAGSIIALFANEGQMSLYSKNAKQKAYNLYSKDMVLKDLLKCYSKIVQFSI